MSNNQNQIVFDNFFCLCGDFRLTREFFDHLETSQLPVKGFTF